MIKCVTLNVYGSILEKPGSVMPPRKGLEEFFDFLEDREVIFNSDNSFLDTCADFANIVLNNPDRKLYVSNFQNIVLTNGKGPKDFTKILLDYPYLSDELLVVGNSHERDILGAKRVNARYIEVPTYKKWDDFDFARLIPIVDLMK